ILEPIGSEFDSHGLKEVLQLTDALTTIDTLHSTLCSFDIHSPSTKVQPEESVSLHSMFRVTLAPSRFRFLESSFYSIQNKINITFEVTVINKWISVKRKLPEFHILNVVVSLVGPIRSIEIGIIQTTDQQYTGFDRIKVEIQYQCLIGRAE
ncbi:hypothetical protein X801_10852, partial [Opisthorchis viverrini]